jgi:hypothetical protein
VLSTVRSQKEESISRVYYFCTEKQGFYSYVFSKEDYIGSWPTAQAETSNLGQVCRKSGNPTFKGPETLDTALDSLHKKITHIDINTKATRRGLYPARHKKTTWITDCNQVRHK